MAMETLLHCQAQASVSPPSQLCALCPYPAPASRKKPCRVPHFSRLLREVGISFPPPDCNFLHLDTCPHPEQTVSALLG